MKHKVLIIFLVLMQYNFVAEAQILKKLKKTIGIISNNISLDKLKRDPITTSFKDVDKTKYLPDGFGNDVIYQNIHNQPYTWEKGFYLTPGFYEGHFKSFCVKAGTYTPRSGNGRFYAELKGPKADIIESIIDGYQQNPDMTQHDVQLLLWAIVAKTDFQKMKGPIKATAIKLLSLKQIARLSKGALDNYLTSEIKKIATKNKAIAYIIEAENKLREKFYKGISNYSEYEQIAMRAGIEPVLNGFNTGRWTKHPNGFFIRYIVKSYSQTTTQIYVPEDMTSYRPIHGRGPSFDNYYMPSEGKYFKSRNNIAVPSDNGAQRLLQSDLPTNGPSEGYGPEVNVDVDILNEGDIYIDSETENSSENDNSNTSSNGNNTENTTETGSNSGANEGSNSGSSNDSRGNEGSESNNSISAGNEDKNPFPCEEVIHPIADKEIKLEMMNQNIPGLLIAIFKGDSIIHMKAYGKMRYDHPLTLDTRLQWASLSKSVTGVAAMQMIEDGRLKLTDKPSQLLSYWPNSVEVKDENGDKHTESRYSTITLRHLLNNTSGIQHYGLGKTEEPFTTFNDKKVFFTNQSSYTPALNGGFNAESSVEQFNKSVLDFNPGKENHYLYSSYGFNLAGAMIDKKISYGYDGWVNKYIKNKLGLKDFRVATGGAKRFGYQYTKDGVLTNLSLSNYESILPSGGWSSTICDLATYTRALSKGELLKKDTLALWKQSNSYMFDTNKGYGLGLNFNGVGNNFRVYHGGTQNGTRSYLHFFPSDHLGIVMLSPFRQAELERLASNLFEEMKLRPGLYTKENKPIDNCRRSMEDGRDLFTGIWKKTSKKQIIRTGLEINEFKDEIKIMRDYGFYLDDFEVHLTDDHKIIYDGVFKEGKKDQVLSIANTAGEMKENIDQFRAKGYEIVDIEHGVHSATTNKYIYGHVLFEKGAPKSTYIYGYTSLNQFIEDIRAKRSNNLKIVDIEGWLDERGINSYSALFVTGQGNRYVIETPIVFQQSLNEGNYETYGSLLDVETVMIYKDPNRYLIMSIWEPKSNETRSSYTSGKQPAISFCTFMNLHEANRDNGYELVDFERIFNYKE